MTARPVEILVIEDDPAHAEATRRALEACAEYGQIHLVDSLAEARRHIARAVPAAIIADLNLVDGKAFELVEDLEEVERIPLLVMTSHGDEAMAVRAMRAGALDYVVKSPETFAQMPRLLDRALREHRHVQDRARAQEALRESEQRLRDIIDFLPDATFAVDRDGRVIAWNLAVEQLSGYGKAEVIGKDIHDFSKAFYTDDDGPVLLDLILEPSQEGNDLYEYVRRDGDRLVAESFAGALRGGKGAHLWLVASPLFNACGDLIGAIESVRDVTEPKRAQLEIQRAFGESRAITQAVRDTLYMVDLDGRLLWWNKRVEEETGLAADQLRQRSFADFFLEEDETKLEKALSQALQEGYSEVQARAKTVKGIRDYRYNGVPVRDSEDRIIGIAGVGQDITELLRDQEDLRLAATVLENTREGVVVSENGSERIVAVNQAYCEITGYSRSEAIGSSTNLLKSGRHDRAFYQAIWASIQQTGHWQGEIWNRRKNGEVFPAWLTINSVRNEQGQITNYVGVMSDISQIKQSEAQLQRLAHYDPLTDLPNRLLLGSRLEHAIERAKRKSARVAVLFIDLDRFKHVNDSLGHPVGDELLRRVAERLRARVRREDTIARLGGDEFVVLLESIEHTREASTVAEMIIELMRRPFSIPVDREIYLGASIGISLYPDNGSDPTELLRNADTAMYQSKAQGRNTYRFYTEALTQAANARLSLETRLRRALEREELTLHYQPQVSMISSRIVGVEALVRWQDPSEGLIQPGAFIPLAEETGLIGPLGAWVLGTACRQMRAWLDEGLPSMTLAVNLSTQQFTRRRLAEQVEKELRNCGLPSVCLELELTESMLMQHNTQGVETMNALRELGVSLAIDDFGTGYSSLAYLKRLPINKLKIDRSFVQGIPHDLNDSEIAATIIAMARNLKLQVLAEGVETAAQRDFLQSAGCDICQGYLFGRPIPAEQIAAHCRERDAAAPPEAEAPLD